MAALRASLVFPERRRGEMLYKPDVLLEACASSASSAQLARDCILPDLAIPFIRVEPGMPGPKIGKLLR